MISPAFTLPRALFESTAHIFKTEYHGKPIYVISLDEEFNRSLYFVGQNRIRRRIKYSV